MARPSSGPAFAGLPFPRFLRLALLATRPTLYFPKTEGKLRILRLRYRLRLALHVAGDAGALTTPLARRLHALRAE
jgi:hypothetical protein